MCGAWRRRAAMCLTAALLLVLGCDAQLHNEAQGDKLVYARGNHWAVGHLMGKKSTDETLRSDDRDVNAYLFTAEADTHAEPSRLLKALVRLLDGPERETEDEREIREQRRWWEDQLARQREVDQAVRILLLALNRRDADGS